MPRESRVATQTRFKPDTIQNQAGSDVHLVGEHKLHALLATVVYADLFDYALTRDEVHRYLIGTFATRAGVDQMLSPSVLHGSPIHVRGPYVTLSGRERLIETRQSRAAAASRLWGQAMVYRDTLAQLPFVRMIGVTGTLAVNNTDDDGDIDLFIITTPGRLWLTRAFVIGVVKVAARKGIKLCPNYLVTENAIHVADRNIFTAHELAQMKPIFGLDSYRHMMASNNWLMNYLPNTMHHTDHVSERSEHTAATKQVTEAILKLPVINILEHWEMSRKSARFAQIKSDAGSRGSEADFGPDWCKGHFQGHGRRTLKDYYDRLHRLGIDGVMRNAS